MKNWIIRLGLCCIFMLLASCLHRSLPVNYAACAASCESRLVVCSQLCNNNCLQCRAIAKFKTAEKYNHYKQEKFIEGKKVTLQLNSFRDPLQCRKVTCNCQADYQICLQSCGGAIRKRLEHAPLCS